MRALPRSTGRCRLTSAVSLCVVCVLLAAPVAAAGQSHGKRVLLVFDEDKGLPGLAVLDGALRSALRAGLGTDVEFFTESLNAAQFPEEAFEPILREYYAKKYGAKQLDLIVGVMGPSVAFLLRHADAIAPGVPIVFCGADADDIRGATLPARMTGIVVRRTFAPTLDVALQLQPGTRQVFVVGGTSDFDRHLQAAARREFQPFEKRFAFTYLTDLSVGKLLEAVSGVPPNSVILYLTMFRDAAGQTYVPHEVAARVSEAAAAPVYVFVDQYLGAGPVGGYLYSLELHGKAAAEIGLRVLNGEPPASIPIHEVQNNQNMFDARQLDRWRLDSRLLPANSVILFREPSVWGRYRRYIVGTGALLTVQTALIVGLLVHRNRRRRAEADLRASVGRIREIGGRLLGAQEAERTRIAQELHDDINQQIALLRIDLDLLSGMLQGDARAVAGEAAKCADGIAESIHDLSHRLYPSRLRLLGLVAAIDGHLRELPSRGAALNFTHEGVPASLSPDVTLCIFRVVQEAVQNALKHSDAANISVHLGGSGGGLALMVADDGAGFHVDTAVGQGLGLVSMRERVESLGGSLDIVSGQDQGTKIEVTIPVTLANNANALVS